VVEHVAERIAALSCCTFFFARDSLERIFVLFRDPHFKKKNHRRRIVSRPLLAIYALRAPAQARRRPLHVSVESRRYQNASSKHEFACLRTCCRDCCRVGATSDVQ
jgi:hypothetical protein